MIYVTVLNATIILMKLSCEGMNRYFQSFTQTVYSCINYYKQPDNQQTLFFLPQSPFFPDLFMKQLSQNKFIKNKGNRKNVIPRKDNHTQQQVYTTLGHRNSPHPHPHWRVKVKGSKVNTAEMRRHNRCTLLEVCWRYIISQ